MSTGVSNFDIDELAELLAMARIKPALVQRHSDPLSADAATQALCRLAGVQYQVPQAHSCCIPMSHELEGGTGDLTVGACWTWLGVVDARSAILQDKELGHVQAALCMQWRLTASTPCCKGKGS